MSIASAIRQTAPQPFFLGPQGHRRFAVWHAAQGAARAAVVLCPPILHEYTRSYRIWAFVATRLAAAGVATLRLDYFGSGDSDGDDTQFSLAGAAHDIELALQELDRRAPQAERILLGVRAGCWPAWSAASISQVDRLWLWQPLHDGAAYLEHLHRLDAGERASFERYPWRTNKPRADEPHALMGVPCCAGLPAAIAAARLPAAKLAASMRIVTLDAAENTSIDYADRQIVLPPNLTAWAEEMYMGDCRLGRDFGVVLDALLERPQPQAAHYKIAGAAAWTR